MNFHGKKKTGAFGVLNKAELTDFIRSKSSEINDTVAGRLAEAFISHDGKAVQGNGGTTLGYLGRVVFHKTALGGGATLFFTTEHRIEPFINGIILAIGRHVGGGSNAYRVLWIHDKHRVDWMLRGEIIL